ncbi:MAG: type II toxin-antitoxin system ParD family antitoxin [Terracidiphilus sp.]
MIDFEENFPMNVSLTRELDKFVAAKVASGRYTSASEVVREALRLLEEQDSKIVRAKDSLLRLTANLPRGFSRLIAETTLSRTSYGRSWNENPEHEGKSGHEQVCHQS